MYDFNNAHWLDFCLKNRFDLSKKDAPKYAFISPFGAGITLVMICYGVISLEPLVQEQQQQPTISATYFSIYNLYHIFYTLCWYYSSYSLCTFLKHLLADWNCNRHANRFVFCDLCYSVIIIL